MSERQTRIFTCDAPGNPPCKSFCDLGHAVLDEDVPKALRARGWKVAGRDQDRHLCMFHKDVAIEESHAPQKEGSD